LPMEALTDPFPTELRTPPVTNTYFGDVLRVAVNEGIWVSLHCSFSAIK
jgi:hypothetical protein